MTEPIVRLMTPGEAGLVVDYFHGATPEHLELLGVDPTRLPPAQAWRARIAQVLEQPLNERAALLVVWLLDDRPVGFSSAEAIQRGERASMHLHVIDPALRGQGIGAACVKATADLYFELLGLKRLYCEPNAFNTGPNRTLQKAGFKYLKTHKTVPGPLNYHQAVTQWVLER